MRLDHVSYVASHDQISDVVQRIGSQIGTAFVDGGIHPRFGTRNFTAPLLNGQYIEVVCPLDHPAAEQTPFGKAVTKKANEGGGWLTWVFSAEDLSTVEEAFNRESVEGHRTKPDGTQLSWKQIGIKEILENPIAPFFIEWRSLSHPSTDGEPSSKLIKIIMNGDAQDLYSILPGLLIGEVTHQVEIEWQEDEDPGIAALVFETKNGLRIID